MQLRGATVISQDHLDKRSSSPCGSDVEEEAVVSHQAERMSAKFEHEQFNHEERAS